MKKDDKIYLNLWFFHLSINLIFAYIYILASTLTSIISRILFYNYKFIFNFTLFFLEQSICAIIFIIFNKNIKIDFISFWKNKYFYIGFSLTYIFNVLSVFYGHQLVLNASMYFALKKLTPLMLFINDFFVGKKKISRITILSIFLIVGGTLLAAKDSFTNDYLGYIIVLISNILTIIYCKLSEIYHKITGCPNIKLIIYNNYLTLPAVFLGIFLTDEYNRVYDYFYCKKYANEGSFYSLLFYFGLYGIFCSILISSFFISNEKNSSLITKLISNSRAIFVTVFLHIFDKKKNKLNAVILIGLIISILGSILINLESIVKNIHTTGNNDGTKKDKVGNEEEIIIMYIKNKNKK